MLHLEALLIEKEEVGPGIFRSTILAEGIAEEARPGQFVHIRVDGGGFMLRRPFSIHRLVPPRSFQIVFQRLGKGTSWLAALDPPARLDMIGPLGSGFNMSANVRHLLAVVGGLGIAPLRFLVDELDKDTAVTLLIGAVGMDRLITLDDKSELVKEIIVTEDGSAGKKGLVTDYLDETLAASKADSIVTCGPEAMVRKVAEQALQKGLPCQVSLEKMMACGVGACLSCVCETKRGYERACVEGPVFDAADVSW